MAKKLIQFGSIAIDPELVAAVFVRDNVFRCTLVLRNCGGHSEYAVKATFDECIKRLGIELVEEPRDNVQTTSA